MTSSNWREDESFLVFAQLVRNEMKKYLDKGLEIDLRLQITKTDKYQYVDITISEKKR